MFRLLLLLPLLFGFIGKAEAQPGGCPFSASPCQATASGGSASRTLAAHFGDTVSVLDTAAVYADTVRYYGSASIASGTKALTISGVTFTSADVGKYLVLSGAGATGTTGGFSSIPVATPGANYQTAPTVSISGGGSGSGATLTPLLYAKTGSVTAGGSSYTNGDLLTLSGGVCNTRPVLTATVSAGAVTAIAVATPGDCSVLPGYTAVAVTGGTGSNATLAINWGVISVQILGGGVTYPTTATTSLTGGSAGTPATLGTAVVTPTLAPLATTIAAVPSAHVATLADNAGTTVSGSQYLTYGHDDCTGITAAIASMTKGGTLYFPANGYGLATCHIALPSDGRSIWFRGSSQTSTAIYALANLADQFFKNGSAGYSQISDMTIDGSGVAAINVQLKGSHQTTAAEVFIRNAAVGGTNVVLGSSDFSTLAWENRILNSRIENEDIYGTTADLPLYNVAIYGTDNWMNSVTPVNARVANINNANGATFLTNVHAFGYPAQYVPLYNYWLQGAAIINGSYADTASVAGMRVDFAAVNSIINGSYFYSAFALPAATQGILLASGVKSAVVNGNSFANVFSAANAIVQAGAPDPSTAVLNNPGATYYSSFPLPTGAAFQLQPADSTTVGGDVRGASAVDLQSCASRTASAQVASGSTAIAIGCANIASAANSAAIGAFNTADSQSIAIGANGATKSRVGCAVEAWGRFTVNGDGQAARCVLLAHTTSTTPTRLYAQGTQSFGGAIPLTTNDAYSASISVMCFDSTNHTSVSSWHFPVVVFYRGAGNFPSMSPATVAAVDDIGTSTGAVALTPDSVTYAAPSLVWTAPNSDSWYCTANMALVEAAH